MSSADPECDHVSYRLCPPAHYVAKINPVTELLKFPQLKFGPFKVGDHKWRLQLKPKGPTHNGTVYVSLYLIMDEPHKLGRHEKVLVDYKFFVFDYRRKKYAIFKERGKELREFSRRNTRWGFSKFLFLNDFKDPKGKYRDDEKNCEIGAELVVSKTTRREEMITFKNPSPIEFRMKIRQFSASESRYQYSEAFWFEGRDWKLKVRPRRDKEKKKRLSVHLEAQGISSSKHLFVEAILRVLNRDPGKHKTYQVNGWLNANYRTCGEPRCMPWGNLNGGFIHRNEKGLDELKFAVKIQILTIIDVTRTDKPIR